MSQSPDQLAAAVRRQLGQLVRDHGVELLQDSRRVRAMLADSVSGAAAEINLVGLALSSGVPASLRDSSVSDVAARLQTMSSVQPADAQWVVESVAEAMGLTSAPAATGPARPQSGRASGPGPRDLVVRYRGQETVVAEGSRATIGRDPGNQIVVDSSAVSRRHGAVERTGAGWTYTDLGSTQGSFVAGTRVTSAPVGGETTVVLGQGNEAATISLVSFGEAATSVPNAPAGPGGGLRPQAQATELPAGARPGGALGGAPAAVTEVGGAGNDAITVRLGGASRTATSGQRITIGREEDNDLVAPAATVSRHHLRIEQRDGVWRLADLGSTSGTWHHGTRVQEAELRGVQEFVLGDLDKGDRLVIEAPGQAPARPGPSGSAGAAGRSSGGSRTAVLAAVAAVAAIALIGGVFTVLRGGGDKAADKPAAAAKVDLFKGTVQIRSRTGSGSGTIIDNKLGLILTNAHVAAPAAVGQNLSQLTPYDPAVHNPTELEVWVSDGGDDPAAPAYLAKVAAVDGYLDLAVLKIDKEYGSGAPIDPKALSDLTEVPIGDSDTLASGGTIKVYGYPGISDSEAPSISTGIIASPVNDPRLGRNAAWNTEATIAHGNSGGLAANEAGELVGVPTWVVSDNGGSNAELGRFRPVNFAADLIKAAREGKPYTSKYVQAAPRGARLVATYNLGVEPADSGAITSTGGDCYADTGKWPEWAFAFEYKGFPEAAHTDIVALYYDADTGKQLVDGAGNPLFSQSVWETKLPRSGCATVTTPFSGSRPAPMIVQLYLGGDMKPLGSPFVIE